MTKNIHEISDEKPELDDFFLFYTNLSTIFSFVMSFYVMENQRLTPKKMFIFMLNEIIDL